MLLSNKRKKKRVVVTMGLTVSLITIAVVIFFIYVSDNDESEKDSAVVKELSSEESSCDEHLEADKESSDCDMAITDNDGQREYFIDFVDLEVLNQGEGVFDIHIRFPNGEDYIVVSGKKITAWTEEGFYVTLDSRENNMLSSAGTDMEVYTGTRLYLSRYTDEQCQKSEPDYPWNHYVLGAHGEANDGQEIYSKRIQLEENLAAFMNQTLIK